MNTPTLALRKLLGLSGALLITGQLAYIAVTQLHAGGDANHHESIFAGYAGDSIWTAVHMGQFITMAIILAGLLALSRALDAQSSMARWTRDLAIAAAVSSLALYGVLQAVDGVALKQAVNAWASAPEPEKAMRFASAEAIRWMEWGMRSYQDFALALALMLFAALVAMTAWMQRPIAFLLGLSGVAYLVQGWVAGTEGFTAMQSVAIVVAWVLSLMWMTWIAVAALQIPDVSCEEPTVGVPGQA